MLSHSRWGDLRRAEPFSDVYGMDRGRALDRVLIERFLSDHAEDVHGDVLEVADDRYARKFGGARVRRADAVDVDPLNEVATILADLTETGSLPAASFDCVIVTQTLQFVSDPSAAVRNLWESLRPGGTLLVTVPVTSRTDPTAGPEGDYWRFTPAGLRRVLTAATGNEAHVAGLGGLAASVGFLLGLSERDLGGADLSVDDQRFPLIAAGLVRKELG